MKKNSYLVAYARHYAEAHTPYWYGTFGQKATIDLYKSKSAMYPDMYKADDFSSQIGQVVHDCVGLIKGALFCDEIGSIPKYNASQDKSAKGMYNASKEKGTMSTFPAYDGCLVYKGNTVSGIHHVGVYIGNGKVAEAKGHKYGCVISDLVSSKGKTNWDFWSQCPYFEKDETSVQIGEYYPAYTGSSNLIDGVLAAIGVPSEYIGSVKKRAAIASANCIPDYSGSAKQNLNIISLAKQGKLRKI